MKIAILHYWLVNVRGGEKVLEALCELYPDADIYTHVYDREKFKSSIISKNKIIETFIGRLPFAKKLYQFYLPLMPLALEELDLSEYDLILSSESGPAKGVIIAPGALHICYCHSPMRYLWDMYHEYKRNSGFMKRIFMPFIFHYLRRWDQLVAAQVGHYVANSKFVSSRIKSYYGRESYVINPPVDYEKFEPSDSVGDYYLFLGQLVPYKKADLAVNTFNQLDKKLTVVGDGAQLKYLKKIAGKNITFLGKLDDKELVKLLSGCKALIFPGVEDFGIVPLEAMACGRPVIAFAKGGALETIEDNLTGVFFSSQTEISLSDAIARFESNYERFDSGYIRIHAKKFEKSEFKRKFLEFVDLKRFENGSK